MWKFFRLNPESDQTDGLALYSFSNGNISFGICIYYDFFSLWSSQDIIFFAGLLTISHWGNSPQMVPPMYKTWIMAKLHIWCKNALFIFYCFSMFDFFIVVTKQSLISVVTKPEAEFAKARICIYPFSFISRWILKCFNPSFNSSLLPSKGSNWKHQLRNVFIVQNVVFQFWPSFSQSKAQAERLSNKSPLDFHNRRNI